MSASLYKSSLSFLSRYSKLPVRGNHLRRLRTLSLQISSCMRTQSSSQEGLSTRETGFEKDISTCVTQTKRWLSSKWTDWESFFAPYARLILRQLARSGEFIFIIDGSETASGCVTLMLSVIWCGYAIPLVWLTKEGKKGHFSEKKHLELLELLDKILPTPSNAKPVNYRIVLLGDGEFDGQEVRNHCRQNGWEFVLRTAIDRIIDCGGGEMDRIDTLEPLEGEEIVFVQKACQEDNAIWWKGKGFDAAIPLLTNMDLGEMACAYYKKRFKIESLFKQFKSQGFKIHKSKVEGDHRVANLIIVVALAFIFTFCMGLIMKITDREILKKFIRPDKAPKMMPITIAQKAIILHQKFATDTFSDLTNNFELFFKNAP
jgi:hypothetical protein